MDWTPLDWWYVIVKDSEGFCTEHKLFVTENSALGTCKLGSFVYIERSGHWPETVVLDLKLESFLGQSIAEVQKQCEAFALRVFREAKTVSFTKEGLYRL